MICQRCGTKYDDNAAVCPVCSQPNVQPQYNNTQPEQQYGYAQPQQYDYGNQQYSYQAPPQYNYESAQQNTAPAQQAQTYYNYGQEYSGTKYNKRKRRKKATSLIISISTVVILLAVFLLNFNAIVGFCLKTFASPDIYFTYVEKRASASATKAFISSYGAAADNMLEDAATEGKLSLSLGEKAKTELGGGDFDWVENFYISSTSTVHNKNNKTDFSAYIGDTKLFGVEAYVDNESGNTLLGLPGLTDKYLSLETQNGNTLTTEDIRELLPSKKTVSDITSRYTKIIKKHSTGIRRATDDFLVDGVEQRIVMLELNFGRSDMIELLEDIATQLKEDEQVLEFFDDFTELLKEKEIADEIPDMRAEFIEAIDKFLKTLDDARTDVTIEIPTFRYRNFVNMKHDIVGKEITVNDKNVLYYLNVQDGKEVGSEVRIGTKINMVGYGTKKDGAVSIDYNMTSNGAQLGTVTVTDLCINKKSNSISGKIKILPRPRLIYDLELPTELAMNGIGLDLDFDISPEGHAIKINILSDEKLYFGINTYSFVSEVEEFTLPKEKIFNGQNEAGEFFKSLDFDALEEKMKKAELPEAFIGIIEYYKLIQEFGIII